ncbi:MAG TPA: 4a-hydroxytetrahydrobiopterin dehydratase [Candidatus Thermoplasmatota archaeon]|nr:4a-hydroxytetrahydrobiopterin dehydratase [Candidatus Thermoplasmatota archaeon]
MPTRKVSAKARAIAKKQARPRPPARPTLVVPPGWELDRGRKSMSRGVKTKDFLEAIALINDIAVVAEEVEHHPDLHLERWNRLRVTTWSHDVGRLTERDARLAARVDEVLRKRGLD